MSKFSEFIKILILLRIAQLNGADYFFIFVMSTLILLDYYLWDTTEKD